MLSVRRLHSALGIGPLGLYLLFHLWENWAVVSGRDPWLDRLSWSRSRMGLAIGLAVAVSLSVHVLSCLRRGDPTEKGLLGSGALRWVQRITGAVVLLFVGFHVHQIWSPKLGADVVALGTYEVLQSALGSPLPLVVYVVGISCLYFHLAHGVCRASVTWRLVSTARGMRTVRYAAGCFGALLWGLTLQVVATFSIGQGLFG